MFTYFSTSGPASAFVMTKPSAALPATVVINPAGTPETLASATLYSLLSYTGRFVKTSLGLPAVRVFLSPVGTPSNRSSATTSASAGQPISLFLVLAHLF